MVCEGGLKGWLPFWESYPAKMLTVTVRPIQKGANGERVLLLMAPMHTTTVRSVVIITSARVAAARSLESTLKAPPSEAAYVWTGNTAWKLNELLSSARWTWLKYIYLSILKSMSLNNLVINILTIRNIHFFWVTDSKLRGQIYYLTI